MDDDQKNSAAFQKQQNEQEKEKRNLKRKILEEDEEQKQGTEIKSDSDDANPRQQIGEIAAETSGAGGEHYFRKLPYELLCKILLEDYGRKELAQSFSLTCKTLHRIAKHILGGFTLPNMEIKFSDENTSKWKCEDNKWKWTTAPPNIICNILYTERILPLPIGPIPRDIVKIGKIKLRAYDERVSKFLQTLGPNLQNGFTVRILKTEPFDTEAEQLIENLYSFGRVWRIEFPLTNHAHPFHYDLPLYSRAHSIFFDLIVHDKIIVFISKWLQKPHPDGKPRILCINRFYDQDLFTELIELLKKNFPTGNGPPISFAIHILYGRPIKLAVDDEFALERAQTGECLVLQNDQVVHDERGYSFVQKRIFRGRIGQTYDELVKTEEEEEERAKQQIIEFCDNSINSWEGNFENKMRKINK